MGSRDNMSAHVLWVQVSVTIRSKRHVHLEIARPVLGGYHNLKLNRTTERGGIRTELYVGATF